jgi:hypothetical protein
MMLAFVGFMLGCVFSCCVQMLLQHFLDSD